MMSGIWRRQDELERRLRRERPPMPARLANPLLQRIEATRARRARSFRVGLAGALSVAMLIALASFGGLGYAASSVQHAVKAAVQAATPSSNQQPQLNSAAAQYGAKVAICTVQPNGKQHTIVISQNAAASYLRTHPKAYVGSCGAFRPRGAKPNVCVRLANGSFVAIWVKPSVVNDYLKRNYRSHRSKNGRC
jgi:hypothetical protein